ncbi:hypothetical protein EMCRGX_G012935 [Ephydatia muelleri]
MMAVDSSKETFAARQACCVACNGRACTYPVLIQPKNSGYDIISLALENLSIEEESMSTDHSMLTMIQPLPLSHISSHPLTMSVPTDS